MGRRWLGRVFGSGADSLAEVKGKWFPANQESQHKLIQPRESFLESAFLRGAPTILGKRNHTPLCSSDYPKDLLILKTLPR